MPVCYTSLALTMLNKAVSSTLISVQGYLTLIPTGGYSYWRWILNTRKIICGTYYLYKNIFNWLDKHAPLVIHSMKQLTSLISQVTLRAESWTDLQTGHKYKHIF